MKGNTNNPNGRPKGSPNKSGTKTREFLQRFLNRNQRNLQRDWDLLRPAERITLFEKLLPYVLPKMIAPEFSKLTNEQIEELFQKLIDNDKQQNVQSSKRKKTEN